MDFGPRSWLIRLFCIGHLSSVALHCLAASAMPQRAVDPLTLSASGYSATFSAVNGSILSVSQPGRRGSIWRSGEQGLWSIKFRDNSELHASDFRTASFDRSLTYERVPGGKSLRMTYRSSAATVQVTVSARESGLELTGKVTPVSKAVLEFALPARLRFDPAAVDRFISPMNGNMGVGLALKRTFFERQPRDRPSAWEHSKPAGPAGYAALYGGPLNQRADREPPVPLHVTPAGTEWLGADLAKRIEGSTATVNRPPTRAQVTTIVVDSPNGPWLSARASGSRGAIWRIGGAVSDAERELTADMVTAVIRRITERNLSRENRPSGRVAVVALRNGPEAGGWASVAVREWISRLRGVPAVELTELRSTQEVMEALASNQYMTILNPYGEWAPAPENGGMPALVSAVRRYVEGGGNWFEVGGYPFFYALQPVRYFLYSTPYPDAFADFFHLDCAAGSASVYRVQPQAARPWEGAKDHAAIFIPGRIACGGDDHGGWCDRPFATFVQPGRTWRAPSVRIAVGRGAAGDLREYCRANGFTRRLESKMPKALLDKFRRSVLVYYAGSAKDKTTHLKRLPVPSLIHFADYLHGGFDKQYPDHLPPNARFGTPKECRKLFDEAHRLGHLVMPYTNPTWWCDHPKGPTFEKAGDAPLVKTLDGKPVYERYGANDGWTITFWHPAVQAANRKTRTQFSNEYPTDILFQDQNGARGWHYDMNPASPTPYAYSDGLISQVAEDCRVRPLSTEAGWDRVVNYESQLCGMSWTLVPTEGGPEWRRLMKHDVPPSVWEVFPLAQYIAHDKTAMLYHDLGQFVTNREVLAWTLGLGFCMSDSLAASALEQDAPREWLLWLDRVQKSVCARYVGEPVAGFRHDRGPKPTVEDDGIIRAAYGRVKVTANLGPTAKVDAGRRLAAHGFYCTAPGTVAGDLAGGPPFVVQAGSRKADIWVYAPQGAEAVVEMPKGLRSPVSMKMDRYTAHPTAVGSGFLRFHLPVRPVAGRVVPPAGLAHAAPRDWPGGKPSIGVLDLPNGPPSNWTRITPADWLRSFRSSRILAESGAQIRPIASVAELESALRTGPAGWLAIIDPYGEVFPESGPGRWREMLTLIRSYVNHGGSWWATAGYSFYQAIYASNGGWTSEDVGPAGMGFFGLPVGGGENDQPSEPLRVTPAGRAFFGHSLSARIEQMSSAVNRGWTRGDADAGHLALIGGARQDFLGASRLQGWGYLSRIGGFWPNPEAVLPAATAAIEHLYVTPPMPVPPPATRYLWHAVATW